MKIKLLDKYIFKQVFVACFACVFVFMLIWIMPETFLKTVSRTLSGVYTIETAVNIILFELPKVLNIALPVGMLLGTIITFDKLSKNFEITVLRGCGFSFFRIIASVIILSIFATIGTFFVSSKLLPYTTAKLSHFRGDEKSSQFVFPVKNNDDSMNKILIVSNFDKNNIRNVIVLNFYDNSEKGSSILSGILVSDFVKFQNNEWIINSGKKYLISEEGIFKDILPIENYSILQGQRAINAFKLMNYSVNPDSNRDRELTNSQLYEYISLLKSEKMDDEYRYMLNKYIQRYTHAFMCIIFTILGCLLGFSRPREQKFVGMLIAVCIIFGYYITIPFFNLLAEKAVLSPFVAPFIVPLICFTSIFVLKKSKDL